MAGEAGLHGDLGRLEVADLADHHDVRILAQDCAQAAGERHRDLGVDLGLADAVDEILDGILDGHDVAAVVVDALERRVQRGRLAGAGRAGDQDDPVRLVDQFVHGVLRGVFHAEGGQVQAARLLVEQAQDDAFAVPGGHRRHAHIDRAAGDAQRDSAVLRQALLGDVELGHDLDARNDQRRKHAARLQHLAHNAVDTETDAEAVLVGFDVHVRGAVFHGFGQYGVDEADDGRVIVAFEQVGGLLQLLRDLQQIHVLVEAADHLHGLVAALFVGLLQERVEDLGRDSGQPQRHAGETAGFGEAERRCARAVHRVGFAAGDVPDQDAVSLGERERQYAGEELRHFAGRRRLPLHSDFGFACHGPRGD